MSFLKRTYMYVHIFANGNCTSLFISDGGINRFAKIRSFSSSMTDIDGEREEESEMSDGGKFYY